MSLKLQYNLQDPINAGVDYSGIPTEMFGKPSKGQDTGKWDEVILDPSSVVNGAFVAARCVVVTSQGQATPGTLGAFVRQTSNGNYVVKVKRDAVPEQVKAIRAQANAAQKEAWKTNGPQPRTQAPQVAPIVPGTQPSTPAQAPSTPAQDPDMAAFLAWKASQAQATQPSTPTVPTQAPRAPKTPAKGK